MPKNTGFIKTFFSLKKNLKELCRWKLQSIPKERKLSTLRKMDEKTIEKIPELSKPISILNLVKYSKQAYYNGNPDYYDLRHKSKVSF
jgi:hypothetical protein